MLLYRTFPYLPTAASDEPGGAAHEHRPQGTGRLDNPSHYFVWYLSYEASGAVGETFGNLEEWSDAMIPFPALPGARRALGTYRLRDDVSLLELDDARNLLERGLRPTQVIERNRAASQAWALNIFRERNDRGDQLWQGVRWWSFHRPQWRIVGYWGSPAPELVDLDALDVRHPAVQDAAASLSRRVV